MTTAQLSPRAAALLQDTYGRINTVDTLLRLQEQVFTQSDLKQIGMDLNTAFFSYGVTGIWTRLHGCTPLRAIVDIASKLDGFGPATRDWLLREIGEPDDDSEGTIERAKQSATLVLVDRPQAVYLDGIEVGVNWASHPTPWEYLVVLARAGKAGETVDYMSMGDNAAPDSLKKYKYALKQLEGMPERMKDLIVPAGRGTQRLDLQPADIRIFERIANDEYREWRPWQAVAKSRAIPCHNPLMGQTSFCKGQF